LLFIDFFLKFKILIIFTDFIIFKIKEFTYYEYFPPIEYHNYIFDFFIKVNQFNFKDLLNLIIEFKLDYFYLKDYLATHYFKI